MRAPGVMGAAAVIALASFITHFEGRVYEAHQDSYGLFAICAGYTKDVKPGDTATPEECDARTLESIRDAEDVLRRAVPDLDPILYPAFVSFIYNNGTGRAGLKDGFLVLKNGKPSTMLLLLKARNYAAACDELPKWTKSDGRQLKGLVTRRRAERGLCHENLQLFNNRQSILSGRLDA